MKTKAQQWESIGFNWCKTATILLALNLLRVEKWALPIVAFLCAACFVAAYVFGARQSRCILQKPLWIAAFWSIVGVGSLWWQLR